MGSQPRGISASRGAAILGVSPYQTQTEVWQTILEEMKPGWNAAHGYTLPESIADKPSIRWGTAFEDAVVELASRQMGENIRLREAEFFADFDGLERASFDTGKVTCHIDGCYGQRGFVQTLHEGKTTTEWNLRENWGEPGTDKIPVQYQVQTQHQMLCTGASKVIVSVLSFPKSPDDWETVMGWGLDQRDGEWWLVNTKNQQVVSCKTWAQNLALMGYFHQFTVEAKPEAQALMLDKYRRFWTDNILGEKPPVPESTNDLRRLFPAPSGTLVVTPEMEAMIDEIAAITSEIGTAGPLAKRKESLKVAVIEAARKADRTIDDESRDRTLFLTATGEKIASWNGKTLSISRK